MIIINNLINTRSNILYKDTSQPRISFTGGVRSNVLERTGVSDVFTSSKITKKDVSALNKTAALYPQDVYYKKNLLINMGENPKNIYRLNSIAGPQEFTKFMASVNASAASTFTCAKKETCSFIIWAALLETITSYRLFN